MHNFHQIAAALIEAGGAVQVHTPEALGEHVSMLLQQPERRKVLGESAYQVLQTNQGAISRTVELIAQVLDRQTSSCRRRV
jgi:3-deoxy-D-manno-octulosonic-acid transferase